jgi:cathepsin D
MGLGVEVTFGTGLVDGEINEDTFNFGNISIPHQKFGEIIKEEGDVFADGKFSGILGLAYPAMAAYGITPVFDSIINNHEIKKNIMSFYYSSNEDTDGEITLGFIDESRFTGQLRYYNVIDKYYWTISLEDILLNGKSTGLCKEGCKAIVDTGTSLITGPTNQLSSLLDQITVEEDCSGFETAQEISFVLNGDRYTLQGSDYILKKKSFFGKDKCRPLMMPLDVPSPYGPAWIFGDVFMQKFYTVFDRDTDRIGFALAKHQ